MSLSISSYGSQVLSSGDLVVRDVASFSQHRVNSVTRKSSANSTYVVDIDSGLSQESTREVYSYDPESLSGKYTAGCLRTEGYQTMPVTLGTEPKQTDFVNDRTTATISQGLSFDSEESAIYFGGSKTFRVMYLGVEPERLVFQYLDGNTSEYVTKFSCAKI